MLRLEVKLVAKNERGRSALEKLLAEKVGVKYRMLGIKKRMVCDEPFTIAFSARQFSMLAAVPKDVRLRAVLPGVQTMVEAYGASLSDVKIVLEG